MCLHYCGVYHSLRPCSFRGNCSAAGQSLLLNCVSVCSTSPGSIWIDQWDESIETVGFMSVLVKLQSLFSKIKINKITYINNRVIFEMKLKVATVSNNGPKVSAHKILSQCKKKFKGHIANNVLKLRNGFPFNYFLCGFRLMKAAHCNYLEEPHFEMLNC